MLIDDLKTEIESLNTGLTVYYGGVDLESPTGITFREMGGEGDTLGIGIEKPIFCFIVESIDYQEASNTINTIYNYLLGINNISIPYGKLIKTDKVGYPTFANMNGQRFVLAVNCQLIVQKASA